ncbi:unnamed protein product [Dibothriocephalus latus]|uniref:Uncharacterized protein n=1 Tax=Dibothriocephalus latus TaxID=60516 RepID=A0A3P7KYU4_DIBLA|nr:unnamed protein product [Dibothriocephalus latus]
MKLISQLQDRHFHQYMEYLAQTDAPKSAQESLPEANHSSPQPRERQLPSADAYPAPSTETAASGETVAAAAASQVECPPPQASAPPAEHAAAPSAEVHEHRDPVNDASRFLPWQWVFRSHYSAPDDCFWPVGNSKWGEQTADRFRYIPHV